MKNEVSFKKRYPFLSRFLIGLLILLIIIGLAFGTWAIVYWAGGTHIAPTLEVFTDPVKVFSTPVPEQTIVDDTADDTADEEPEAIYVYVTPEPTAVPVVTEPPAPTTPPTAAPTAVPTTAPASHATFTIGGNQVKVALLDESGKPVKKNGKQVKGNTDKIMFKINNKWVYLMTFEYHGGYFPADDPYLISSKRENDGAYGASIYGKTLEERIYNWLRELVKSPHQIIRLQTQMGIIAPKSLAEENQLAYDLAHKSPDEYDKIANETLTAFYKKLYGGHVETSTDWNLENYMSLENKEIKLHGRLNGDDETGEGKDLLITFYASGAKKTFVSAKQGYQNTAGDVKSLSGKYSVRAWINLDEGGTWKWKKTGGGGSDNPTPKPTGSPTSTPTSGPTATPGPTSTPTPRPTKDPGTRPTPPIGGGETNPENSADPQTTSAPTSTPAPANTATPAPTATPTAVPTAVVRPTEVCEVPASTPIREDQATPPPADEHHNVPTAEPGIGGGNNNGDFDPDSI